MLNYIVILIPMVVWGSLGIFVKNIPLTGAQIALARTVIGGLFLYVVYKAQKGKLAVENLKKYLPRLLLSGAAMGFNWVLLFESYKYVSVSTATLTYYCAPAVIILASPWVLKEKLTLPKIVGVATAMGGMILVNISNIQGGSVKGVMMGLTAAVLYACVTLINKGIKGFTGLELSLIQLGCAACILLPYNLVAGGNPLSLLTPVSLGYLMLICMVHTGIAFVMYFSAIQKLPAHTIAMCSFADPVSALMFSAVFLQEQLSVIQIIGALVIIGGAMIGEIYQHKQTAKSLAEAI